MITAAWLRANSIITSQQNVWVAYSGGVDSHVLLDLARQCFNNVRAIHINHNLSPDDAEWQQHCETVCAALKIPLKSISVDANPKSGQSPEEAARLARRQAWHTALSANDVLLVAHHAADQAETVLFRLLRGAGPRGLSGIKAISKIGAATLWRPLLGISKQQILDYAEVNKLNWLQDISNTDDRFDRNYLRKHIFPAIQQRWPAAVANINRAAKLCEQLEEFMQPQILAALTQVTDQNQILNLAKLRAYSQQWQYAIVRAWLQQQDLMPSSQHLKILFKQVIAARQDAVPEYILGNKVIRRSQDQLYLLDQNDNRIEAYNVIWDLLQPLLLPNGKSLSLADVSANTEFINKLHQYEITVRLGIHGRKAKKIFQQHGIPPWERAKYPLLFANDRLVSIVGLWYSARLNH